MPGIDRLAADTANLTTQINALITAAAVVVADGAAGTSQPHLDTLSAAMLAIGVTRARMIRLSEGA